MEEVQTNSLLTNTMHIVIHTYIRKIVIKFNEVLNSLSGWVVCPIQFMNKESLGS